MCLIGVGPQSLCRSHPRKLKDKASWSRPEPAGAGQPCPLPGMGWAGASSRVPAQSHPERPMAQGLLPIPDLCSHAGSQFSHASAWETSAAKTKGFRSPSCCRVRDPLGWGAHPQNLWVEGIPLHGSMQSNQFQKEIIDLCSYPFRKHLLGSNKENITSLCNLNSFCWILQILSFSQGAFLIWYTSYTLDIIFPVN